VVDVVDVDVEVEVVEVEVDEVDEVDVLDVEVEDELVEEEEVDVGPEVVDVVAGTEVELDDEVDDDDVVGAPSAVAGCQLGSVSMAGTGVGSRVTPEPSGFITKMSKPFGAVKALVAKTILVPSGDHAGSTPFWPEAPTIFVGPLPSAFMTQISPGPLPYTIRAPSGDQSGDRSSCPLPVVDVSGRWLEPSGFIAQMSLLRT
jgi:hypothetical protein